MNNQDPWIQPANPSSGGHLPGNDFGIGQPQGGGGMGMGGGLPGNDPLDGPMDQVRQHIENQIHQAIDAYAGRLPGGSMFADQAKRAASGILDGLERQADQGVDSRLGGLPGMGGMGGKYDPNVGHGGNVGGQL